MKIEVDLERCCGHACCAAVAPEVYKLNDEGYQCEAVIVVPLGMEKAAADGALSCPERALTVVEVDT
jgi:ferredoxin